MFHCRLLWISNLVEARDIFARFFLPLSLDLFIPTFHISVWFRCNGAFTSGNLGFCVPNGATRCDCAGLLLLVSPWIAAKLIPIHPEIRFHFAWFNFGGGITHTHMVHTHSHVTGITTYALCSLTQSLYVDLHFTQRTAYDPWQLLCHDPDKCRSLCIFVVSYGNGLHGRRACMLSETWESLCSRCGIFWFSFSFIYPALGHMQWNSSATFTHTHSLQTLFLARLNPFSA